MQLPNLLEGACKVAKGPHAFKQGNVIKSENSTSNSSFLHQRLNEDQLFNNSNSVFMIERMLNGNANTTNDIMQNCIGGN